MGDDGVCRHPVNVSFIIILVVAVVIIIIISISISISISHHQSSSVIIVIIVSDAMTVFTIFDDGDDNKHCASQKLVYNKWIHGKRRPSAESG